MVPLLSLEVPEIVLLAIVMEPKILGAVEILGPKLAPSTNVAKSVGGKLLINALYMARALPPNTFPSTPFTSEGVVVAPFWVFEFVVATKRTGPVKPKSSKLTKKS